MAYESAISLPHSQRSVAAAVIIAERNAAKAYKRSGSDEDLKAYEAAVAAREAAEGALIQLTINRRLASYS